MLFKQPSTRVRDDEEDDAPIWSPAIKAALEDWYTAKHEHDEEGMKSAARTIVDATAAYHKAGGVPLFAHRPLPPQFVEAEIGSVQNLPQANAAHVVDSFINKFDDSAKPVVTQQVAKVLSSKQSALTREAAEKDLPVHKPTAVSDRPASPLSAASNELSPNQPGEDNPTRRENRGWQEASIAYDTSDEWEREWLATASPQERYEYFEGQKRVLRQAVPFLGRALYELSPLPEAQEFVDDVRAGRYASAALAVILIAIPELKAVRVTHHIIAKLARQHRVFDRILSEYKISINDPANLARMIEDAHRVLHTRNYYNFVASRLSEATDEPQFRQALREIKNLLEKLKDRADSRAQFPPVRPPRR